MKTTKKTLRCLTIFAALMLGACSETGYYVYHSPYTYNPHDPDYLAVTNPSPPRNHFKDYRTQQNRHHRHGAIEYEWYDHHNRQAPIRGYEASPSVIVYPLD